jgi:heme exporter protein D
MTSVWIWLAIAVSVAVALSLLIVRPGTAVRRRERHVTSV